MRNIDMKQVFRGDGRDLDLIEFYTPADVLDVHRQVAALRWINSTTSADLLYRLVDTWLIARDAGLTDEGNKQMAKIAKELLSESIFTMMKYQCKPSPSTLEYAETVLARADLTARAYRK